jgi:hypothetical protein
MFTGWRPILKLVPGVFGMLLAVGAAAEEQKAFTSGEYGYRLRLPRSWNVSVSGNGIPTIYNYDPKDALPQGLFPEHGADILLIPFAVVQPATKGHTLTEWIHSNTAHGYSNVVVKQVSSPNGSKHRPSDVVEVRADFRRAPDDEELQRTVCYYFTLHGMKFRLMLEYWKDDPRSAYFESVLDAVFRSLESP